MTGASFAGARSRALQRPGAFQERCRGRISPGNIKNKQITTETAIYVTPLRDIYLTIGDQLEDGSWIVNIQINYLIRWIWISAVFMSFAGLMLIFSKQRQKI